MAVVDVDAVGQECGVGVAVAGKDGVVVFDAQTVTHSGNSNDTALTH